MTWLLVRHVTAWLWRFYWFRRAVIAWISAGLPGTVKLAVHTPFLFSLREMWLQRGDLHQAKAVADLLRATDPLL